MKRLTLFFLSLGLVSLLVSCREDVDTSALQVYDGPMKTTVNVDLVQSDSAIIRSQIKAPLQLEYANGNLEFPEGIDINFFDKEGNITTTMRADKGYFLRDENIYKGVGDVQVENNVEDQSMKSEEIFYNMSQKKIYTEKYVTIREGLTLFKGTGMEADETFTNYKLKDVIDSRMILPGEEGNPNW